MAYYKINGVGIDIHCGNASAWEKGCNGKCEECRFCEVEEIGSGKKYRYIDSKYNNESVE